MLVLACLDTGGAVVGGNQASLWVTLLPSVWSYMLAARSRGIGTVWTTRHLSYAAEVAALLGIPPGVHQAYYRRRRSARRRTPLETSLHVDRW